MVLMTVGDNDSPDSFFIPFDKGKIRNYKVNAEHFGIGESESAVNDKHIVTVLVKSHIFTDLVKSAEKCYPYG